MQTFSKMMEELLSPCLILSIFISSLDLQNVQSWLPAFLLSFQGIIQGFILAWIANKLYFKDQRFSGIIMLSTGFGIVTNFQLNLIHLLQDQLQIISDQSQFNIPNMAQPVFRAQQYTIINTFCHTFMRWTLGKQILINASSEQKRQELQKIMEKEQNNSCYKKYFGFMNKPLYSMVLTVFICLVPQIRNPLIEKGSFWYRSIFNGVEVLGKIVPAINLITLGGNLFYAYQDHLEFQKLEQKDDQNQISKRILIGATVLKLLINPLIGALFLYFLCQTFIIDPVLLFIQIMTYATPMAIIILVIANIYTDVSNEISKLMLIGFAAVSLTLPIVLIIFFWVIVK